MYFRSVLETSDKLIYFSPARMCDKMKPICSKHVQLYTCYQLETGNKDVIKSSVHMDINFAL